jgi:ribA/ribD-fused uncharacterized protein
MTSSIATFTANEYKNAICFWQGELFSNFADCTNSPIVIHGKSFNWSEQVFMLVKLLYFYTKKKMSQTQFNNLLSTLLNANNPMDTKKVGRAIPLSDADLAEWNNVSSGAMYYANWHKYQDSDRRKQLVATTGKRLVEASPYDKIWGVGYKVYDFRKGKCQGENRLGQVLEDLRSSSQNVILPQYQQSFTMFDDLFKILK